MTWHDITVRQFKEIVVCLKAKPLNEVEELDQRFLLASIIYDKPVDTFKALPIKEFHNLENKFRFIFSADQLPAVNPPSTIYVEGYRFKFNYDPSKLKASDIIELTTLSKLGEGIVEHIDKIVLKYAKIKKPFWKFSQLTERRALELIGEIPITKANAVGAFFLTWWARHLPTIQSYLITDLAKVNKQMEKLLQDIGDGSSH